MRACLKIVLLPQDDFERDRPALVPRQREEDGIPGRERRRGAQNRPKERRVLSDGIEKRETGKAQREDERENQRAPGPQTRHVGTLCTKVRPGGQSAVWRE